MKYIGITWLATIVLSITCLIMGNGKMVAIILCAYWLIRLYDTFRRDPLRITRKQGRKEK